MIDEMQLVIKFAIVLYKMCMEISVSRVSIRIIGEKIEVLVAVLQAIDLPNREEAPHSYKSFQVALSQLQNEIQRMKQVLKKTKRMSRPLYVMKARRVREQLEQSMNRIQFSMGSLNLSHNVVLSDQLQTLQMAWTASEMSSTVTDGIQKEVNEKKRIMIILNERNSQLRAAQLAQEYGLNERSELEELLNEARRDCDDMRCELKNLTDSTARGKVEAEQCYIQQIIDCLSLAEASLTSERKNEVVPSAEPPTDILCPISLQIMEDPVIVDAKCCHTFDRASLQVWVIERGNTTCPTCNGNLRSGFFAPNTGLRGVIATKYWEQYQHHVKPAATTVDRTVSATNILGQYDKEEGPPMTDTLVLKNKPLISYYFACQDIFIIAMTFLFPLLLAAMIIGKVENEEEDLQAAARAGFEHIKHAARIAMMLPVIL